MARFTLTDFNLGEFGYYPNMIFLDSNNGSCNDVDDLSMKIYVPSKTKDISLKTFNLTTRIYEAKTLVKQIPCDCRWKLNGTKCSSFQKYYNDISHCECKKDSTCKKIIVGILAHIFVRIVDI